MYQCKLQIMIFSKDPMLPEVMDTLCPPERFSHTVTVSGNPAPELADGSDVVIWDLGSCILPLQLRPHCREGTVLVYCGEQGMLDGLAGAPVAPEMLEQGHPTEPGTGPYPHGTDPEKD